MGNQILVSVVVITYNSEKYVIETLESVKNQTYKNIELVITDDASTDNTLLLVNKWLDKNKERFVNCKIVESKENTGITKNCNRGIEATTGEYVKLIAGDDLLMDECINDLLKYVIDNNLSFTYAKVIPFADSGDKNFEEKLIIGERLTYNFFDLNVNQQYKRLLKNFCISTIGLFFKREFMINLGCFNEEYIMMEDYPFAVKVSSMGYKLNLLDKYVAKYRVRSPGKRKIFYATKRKNMHAYNLRNFRKNELLPRMKEEKMYLSMYELSISMFADRIDNFNSGKIFLYVSKIIRYLSFSVIANKIRVIKNKVV